MPFTRLTTKFMQFRSRYWADEEGGYCRVVVLARGYKVLDLSPLFVVLSGGRGGVDINDPTINSSKEVISLSWLSVDPLADYRKMHAYISESELRIARATGVPSEIKEGTTELDIYATPEDPLTLELREAEHEYKQRMRVFKEMADVMKGMRRR